MKIIFWSFVDDVINKYVILNKSLQRLSKYYDFYALCSGKKSTGYINDLYNANIIESENNLCLKSKLLFDHLKNINFDVLIKIDMDSVLMDEKFLIKNIKHNIIPMSIMGNLRKSKTYGIIYVRGGCNATHSSVIKKIDMIVPPNKKEYQIFDKYYSDACNNINTKYIDFPLFEISKSYSNKLPVWHPIKNGNRLNLFKKALDVYKKNHENP